MIYFVIIYLSSFVPYCIKTASQFLKGHHSISIRIQKLGIGINFMRHKVHTESYGPCPLTEFIPHSYLTYSAPANIFCVSSSISFLVRELSWSASASEKKTLSSYCQGGFVVYKLQASIESTTFYNLKQKCLDL